MNVHLHTLCKLLNTRSCLPLFPVLIEVDFPYKLSTIFLSRLNKLASLPIGFSYHWQANNELQGSFVTKVDSDSARQVRSSSKHAVAKGVRHRSVEVSYSVHKPHCLCVSILPSLPLGTRPRSLICQVSQSLSEALLTIDISSSEHKRT